MSSTITKIQEKIAQQKAELVSPTQALNQPLEKSTTNDDNKNKPTKEPKAKPKGDNKDNSKEIMEDKNDRLSNLLKEKKRVEDTHTRSTFLVENELLKEINKLAKDKRGFKTEFINFAIELALDEYKKIK